MKSSPAEEIPVASMIDDLLKDAFPSEIGNSNQNIQTDKYHSSNKDSRILKPIQMTNNIPLSDQSKNITHKSAGSLFDMPLDDEKELLHQVNSVEPCLDNRSVNVSIIYVPEQQNNIRSYSAMPPKGKKECKKDKYDSGLHKYQTIKYKLNFIFIFQINND
jgi:hypothetical protein